MAHFPTRLALTVRRQHGIVTGAQLRQHGVGPELVERLRARGLLTRVHPGFFRVLEVGDDFQAACTVVCHAHPRGAIGGAAAAALWGFADMFRPLRPEFVHADDDTPRQRVRRVTYRSSPEADHVRVVERDDGVRLFDRAETWLDCVAELNGVHAERFTRHVLDAHCPADDLFAAVERWEMRRRSRPPGRSRRLLEQLAGSAPAAAAA